MSYRIHAHRYNRRPILSLYCNQYPYCFTPHNRYDLPLATKKEVEKITATKNTLNFLGTVQIEDVFLLAASPGFEPRLTESESAVLPLDDEALIFVETVYILCQSKMQAKKQEHLYIMSLLFLY